MFKRIPLILLAVLMCGVRARAAEKSDVVAIIVNKKANTENVTLAELARYFRGERVHDADNNRIVILMREHGSPERVAVLKHIFHMTEQEYSTYFLQATFTGQVMEPPKKVRSANAVRQYVFDNPGAIGYLRLSEVDDSVKVLKIDGKSPGEEGYPLTIGK